MRRRFVYAIGLMSCLALVLSTMPASAAGARHSVNSPLTSVDWSFRHQTPFYGTRFDGEYLPSLDRVYFLGFRTLADQTDGQHGHDHACAEEGEWFHGCELLNPLSAAELHGLASGESDKPKA